MDISPIRIQIYQDTKLRIKPNHSIMVYSQVQEAKKKKTQHEKEIATYGQKERGGRLDAAPFMQSKYSLTGPLQKLPFSRTLAKMIIFVRGWLGTSYSVRT